ncbi:MAG: twin-arginine translocase subunit TatC [Synergistaceae bacterium]|jgi:sec-independent protein translocase protein TatC|nr:twin-arginine translocase subunit TatC [Synergistaceae bacterium]
MPTDAKGEWEEHLEELRRRIISVLAVFFAATVISFVFSEGIASFFTDPVSHLGARLYSFSPAEKLMAYLHISALSGAVFTAPFFILQTALFIWPALKGAEKTWARFALFSVPFLFLAGMAASYSFLAPKAISFFLSFASSDGVEPLWSFREYLSLLISLMLAAGVSLQMPLVMLILFALGALDPRMVAKSRSYIVLLIFFLAALITPPDVISQIMFGVPLYLLFEATLFLGRIIAKKR